MSDKGDEIRFVKGTYQGRNGWLNKNRRSKKSRYSYVIVDLEEEGEKPTRVLTTSIRKPHKVPTSFEEAALQQHPDIELAMIRLCEMWAECGLNDGNNATRLFVEELHNAHESLKTQGNKARHRQVHFEEGAAESYL